MRGIEAKVSPDNRAPGKSVFAALFCPEETLNLHFSRAELALERRECGRISVSPSANDHIDGRDPPQHILADNFPESSLELISLHNGATILRNDEAYAGMMQKGSDDPEVQMLSSDALPLT